MEPDSANGFRIGDQDFAFEIAPPPYTKRPLQVLSEQPFRWEDRFHRTVKITRLCDARSWTGATDLKSRHLKDLAAYLRGWLGACFTQWDQDQIPEGFDIPQEGVPSYPAKHHCPEFPMAVSTEDDSVDAASEGSFPASDPPEWTGLRIA